MTTITGYAATFGRPDQQQDLIERGAFLASLEARADRVPFLWQHQITEPIGRIVEAREDARGLWFRAEIAGTRRGGDAMALIESGVLSECSIGFLPRRVRFEERSRRTAIRPVRVIEQLDLIEISLVTLAANSDACLLTVDGRIQKVIAARRRHQFDTGPPGKSAADLRRRLRVAVPVP
jgi:HK97 family phage prohead protease